MYFSGRDLIILIAWSQCLFSVITIFSTTAVQRFLNPQTPWLRIPLMTFLHRDVLAMNFAFIGVIVMNNLLLKHIGVSFYQVARSSTLIFTVILSWVLLGIPLTWRVTVSCFLIVVGFFVSMDQEILLNSLSLVSISYGMLASMSAALGGIFIKRADRLVQGDSWSISIINNLNSLVLLFPLLLSTGDLQFTVSSGQLLDLSLWWRLVVTGVLSLLVGWASIRVISLTSPLTHNMSINAKSLLQTLIAVVLHGETKTMAWWVGNFLVILGIMNYSFSRSRSSGLQHELNMNKPVFVGSTNMEAGLIKKQILSA